MSSKTCRWLRAIAFLGICGVILVGGTAGAATQSAKKPVKGGTLTLVKNAEQANGWDPVRMQGVPTNSEVPGAFAIYDALLYEDYTTSKLVGRIAESLVSSDGGTNWTLKLRPGVKFSDGTAFDAEAVRFNWARAADPQTAPTPLSQVKVPVQQIANMTVADPTTLKITLKAPDPVWDRRVAYTDASIASPTALKAAAGTDYGNKPIGAGPFILKEWIRDVSQTYVKNPTYWEKGHPYLDGLVVKFVPDDLQRLNTVQTGAANVGQVFDPTYYQKTLDAGLKAIPMSQPGGGWGMSFNTTKAPFDDVRVRQAFSLAIDRKQFNVTRRGGTALMRPTVETKGSPYYDKTEKNPDYDLAGAQKLIDSYVAEKGPISFTWLSFNTPYIVEDTQLILAQFTKLKNFEVKPQFASSSEVVALYSAGNFQMIWQGVRWNEPATDLLNSYMTGGSNNIARYSNPTVDAAGAQLRTTTDLAQKKKLTHEIVMQVLKDVPNVWITTYMSTTFLQKTVQNYVPYFDARPLLDSVWISNKKA
jgi:peptide/nickel transport system substrate-binding protein